MTMKKISYIFLILGIIMHFFVLFNIFIDSSYLPSKKFQMGLTVLGIGFIYIYKKINDITTK